MSEIYERPFEVIRKVFCNLVPDVSYSHTLSCIEPDDHVLGVASERAQLFFVQARQVGNAPVRQASQKPIAYNEFDKQLPLRFWNLAPPQQQKQILLEVLNLLFWEQVYMDIPIAHNALNPINVYQGYNLAVESPLIKIVPDICPVDDQVFRFMDRVEDIFKGKCFFEGSLPITAPRPNVRVGKLQNELVKQLAIFEMKLGKRMLSLFPEMDEFEVERKFANEPHMEYIRYRRLESRLKNQIKLLSLLVQMGVGDETLNIQLPESFADGQVLAGMVMLDSDWDIVMFTGQK